MNSPSIFSESEQSESAFRFGSPSIATASDHQVIARLEGQMHRSMDALREGIRTAFPGVLHTIGTLSDGDGSGFITLTIQGEHVEKAQKMFPNVVVSAFTQEGYNSAKIPFVERAVAADIERVIREKVQGALFMVDIETAEDGRRAVALLIQGERLNEARGLIPGAELHAFTQEDYEMAAKKTPSTQAA